MHYLLWLLLSACFCAAGEYMSKRWVMSPSPIVLAYMLLSYLLGVLAWLPALYQRNQLSVVGTIWSVLSMLATIALGTLVFNEKITSRIILGFILAFASVVVLSGD